MKTNKKRSEMETEEKISEIDRKESKMIKKEDKTNEKRSKINETRIEINEKISETNKKRSETEEKRSETEEKRNEMENIIEFVAKMEQTEVLEHLYEEFKAHTEYLQHMTKKVEPEIKHIIEQMRNVDNISNMEELISLCDRKIKKLNEEKQTFERKCYSQKILEFLQNNIYDENESLLKTFELHSAEFHTKKWNYNEYYKVSFSLNGVNIYFDTVRGANVGTINMTIGNVKINSFAFFKDEDEEENDEFDIENFGKYAKDAGVTVKEYLSLIYAIWDSMTEGTCFRDICDICDTYE